MKLCMFKTGIKVLVSIIMIFILMSHAKSSCLSYNHPEYTAYHTEDINVKLGTYAFPDTMYFGVQYQLLTLKDSKNISPDLSFNIGVSQRGYILSLGFPMSDSLEFFIGSGSQPDYWPVVVYGFQILIDQEG